MTENKEPGSLIEDFKSLGTKQWIALVGTMIICIVLIYTGMILAMCMGFLILAILLYMIPHIAGVSSPKVKAVYGAVFIMIVLLIACFAYTGSAKDRDSIPSGNEIITDGEFDPITGIVKVYSTEDLDFRVSYAPVSAITFGYPAAYDKSKQIDVDSIEHTGDTYSAKVDLEEGKYYYIEVGASLLSDDSKTEHWQIFYNTGISSGDVSMLNLNGSWLTILEIAIVFYIMLIFSELMRRSARKKRDQMVKEGRLYPEGYDKCKECGTMVLPGEVVCRKCGAPIEVPEELKVLHKKDYFQCSECGTEVPMDAKFCPKCGAVFDEDTENVIEHVDGTIDSSTETFECSECGKAVPANAKRCPYCGAEFDEDDE